MKNPFSHNLKARPNPWFYFFLFLSVFFLLSTGGLSLQTSLFLVLFGLVLPLGWGLYASGGTPAPQAPLYRIEDAPSLFLGWPGWVLAGTAALALRFLNLGSGDWWWGDGVLNGMGAIALLRHWNWDLFETFGQIPTTLSRICYVVMRLTHRPVLSLQFSNAALSSLILPLGYLACRQYFSRSFSTLVTLLLMFNYWALWTARTGYGAGLVLLWQFGVFFALGCFLNAAQAAARTKGAFFLGAVTGLGPYFGDASWVAMALLVFLVLAWKAVRSKPRVFAPLPFFTASFLLAAGPFLFCLAAGGYGGHIRDVAQWNRFSLQTLLETDARYVSVLFWSPLDGFPWPGSGGLMNLILGPCALAGFLELWRAGRKGMAPALSLALALFFLPAFLSKGLEPTRILFVLPLLLVLAALGMRALALALPRGRRSPFLPLILAVCFLGDAERLYRFFPGLGQAPEYKSPGQQAYEILRPYFTPQKPGFIFSEMVPDTTDPCLEFATYDINSAWNPDLPAQGGQWAAVLTDDHYVPFLARRFPGAQWTALTTPDGKPGRRALGLVAVTETTAPVLRQWRDDYAPLQDLNWEIMDLPNGASRFKVLSDLAAFYPRVPDDPFLQSCFFDKLVFNYAWELTFHPEDGRVKWENYSGIFHSAFGKSYQDARLCEKFGRLLAVEGRKEEARKVFRKALALMPGNAWLEQEMGELGL